MNSVFKLRADFLNFQYGKQEKKIQFLPGKPNIQRAPLQKILLSRRDPQPVSSAPEPSLRAALQSLPGTPKCSGMAFAVQTNVST